MPCTHLPNNQFISNLKQDEFICQTWQRKKQVGVPRNLSSKVKGSKVAQAVASELISLGGNKDVVSHQILNSLHTGHLFASTRLAMKLPLLRRGGGHAPVCAVLRRRVRLGVCWSSAARFRFWRWGAQAASQPLLADTSVRRVLGGQLCGQLCVLI